VHPLHTAAFANSTKIIDLLVKRGMLFLRHGSENFDVSVVLFRFVLSLQARMWTFATAADAPRCTRRASTATHRPCATCSTSALT